MSLTGHANSRIHRLKVRAAWQAAIEDTSPIAMVTLGTNRAIGEEELLRLVSRALFALDRERLGRTRRPERRSALSRVAAFILPEKVGLNAHAHLLIYSPISNRHPDSALVRRFDETRLRSDFLGRSANRYDKHLYEQDRELAPRLERIWRRLVPGAHYHARRTDERVARGIDYVLKELPWHWDRDVHFSQQFWRSDQKHLERTLPLNQGLRPVSGMVDY